MKNIYIYLSLFSVLLFAACDNETQITNTNNEDIRIISLMPSNTEIIAELGMEDSLTGITTADNFPEDLNENLTRLDTFALDEESMMVLNPTHIVSHQANHDANKNIIDRVASNTGAATLIVDDAGNIDEIYSTITDIGVFIGKEEQATVLNASLQQDVENIQREYGNRERQDKALILVSTTPDIYIAGNGTFIDDFLKTLNIGNVFEDVNGYPAITSEDLIAREPETVISTLGVSNEELTNELNNISGLEGAPITREENQCTPNPDTVSRPGPRFTEGLAAIAECVYE
ncbi:MAG: helical backbone metal receptor [Jeotgalicoccus sp.]|nr:helical backbone metal receptor [Jeotgalicoccus sp.]